MANANSFSNISSEAHTLVGVEVVFDPKSTFGC